MKNRQYEIIYHYPNSNDFYNYESAFKYNKADDCYYYEPIINKKYDSVLFIIAAILVFVLTPIIGVLALGWFIWRLLYKPFFGN